MRHPIEIQEKIDHLKWHKQELIYYFRLMPLIAKKHAIVSAYYRTIDNEIALLRWVLGEIEQTWSDSPVMYTDHVERFDMLPPNEFPHLPFNRTAKEYWGKSPVPVCPYFSGPDAPSDDPNFDPGKARDPSTWKRRPRRLITRFYEGGDSILPFVFGS